ncbi:MAG TPA: thiamine-phosphate kinase [Gammaproteobacteria bacterium]|nr:thiamine-phosphate kinase [Gammaproteobacteria bacterium]
MDEFALIRRYFSGGGVVRDDTLLGIGDDAAVLHVPEACELVVTADNLVSGVHFPAGLDPYAVGYRALAANLSDLAAMGAEPAWVLLSLTLPTADEHWLAEFARGFFAVAARFNIALVGGNLARGPLNVAITAHGLVPAGKALTRNGARAGDAVFVTGHPGDAAAGLKQIQSGTFDMDDACVRRFCHPEPRVAAGIALRDIASAMIDVSDGLLADLAHLLEADALGATLELANLPLSARLIELHGMEAARQLALTGGDDYELCFSMPEARVPELQAGLAVCGCIVTRIGGMDAEPGLRLRDQHGDVRPAAATGYRHF